MPDPSSTPDHRVVSIRTGRKFVPGAPDPAGQNLSDDLDQYARAEQPDDFRQRMIANVAAFFFVGFLVVAGIWLANALATMRKNQDCVLAGKRNCAPIDAPASSR